MSVQSWAFFHQLLYCKSCPCGEHGMWVKHLSNTSLLWVVIFESLDSMKFPLAITSSLVWHPCCVYVWLLQGLNFKVNPWCIYLSNRGLSNINSEHLYYFGKLIIEGNYWFPHQTPWQIGSDGYWSLWMYRNEIVSKNMVLSYTIYTWIPIKPWFICLLTSKLGACDGSSIALYPPCSSSSLGHLVQYAQPKVWCSLFLGGPLDLLPCAGCQSRTLETTSDSLLAKWPANLNLLVLNLSKIGSKSP